VAKLAKDLQGGLRPNSRVLKQNGLDVGKETLKSHLSDITDGHPQRPVAGDSGNARADLRQGGEVARALVCHRGDLYLNADQRSEGFCTGAMARGRICAGFRGAWRTSRLGGGCISYAEILGRYNAAPQRQPQGSLSDVFARAIWPRAYRADFAGCGA
jgi:hypothetical protein